MNTTTKPGYTKFYRLEDKNGNGIYNSDNGEIDNIVFSSFAEERRHPGPRDDSKLKENALKIGAMEGEERRPCINENYIFGFSTLKQYRNWFYSDEILAELAALGVKLKVYKTKDFAKGNTQMMARKETLILLETCSLL